MATAHARKLSPVQVGKGAASRCSGQTANSAEATIYHMTIRKKKLLPFPSTKVLQRKLATVDCVPGTQWDFITLVKMSLEQSENLPPSDLEFAMSIDEMAIHGKIGILTTSKLD